MPQFLILANDYIDEDCLTRRIKTRPAHLQRMQTEKMKGIFITGGALLTDNGKMNGSMLVVELENKNAVEKWIENDPYLMEKVWNEIKILPFRTAAV